MIKIFHIEVVLEIIITSFGKGGYVYLLGKGGYVFGSVGLSVCLFVGVQHYSKSYEWPKMKFYGGILGGIVKNWLKFGGVLHITRSTRRAQTSLAETDHYSHISQCNNVEPWLWKANPKGFGSLPAPRSGYATTIMVFFFAHLFILEYPHHHQNLISSSLYYPGPVHNFSSQSIHNFLSNVLSADKQTNQCYQTHNLLWQGGNEMSKWAPQKAR